jgi:hypothetical protein
MPNKMGFSVIRSIHSHTPLFQGFCMIEMLVSGWKFAHFYDVQTMKCLSFLFQFFKYSFLFVSFCNYKLFRILCFSNYFVRFSMFTQNNHLLR